MKILLVGEYSRLHNSLKEGLVALGHEVTLVGTGDLFKKLPSDILLERKYDQGWGRKWKILVYLFSGIDLTSVALWKQFKNIQSQLKGYDVVQLINELPFGASITVERKIMNALEAQNDKLFLLSCGTDFLSVSYALDKNFKYSILEPYFEGKVKKSRFKSILKYATKKHKRYHLELMAKVDGVIASDLDYHIPLTGHPKYKGLIPNPVNIDKLPFQPNRVTDKVHIFHGINRRTYYKKGSDYFEAALDLVQQSHGDRIKISRVENLPYEEYISTYNQAHILLDQALSYDQGYNALEAMAKGKVVFTGAEEEFREYYKLNEAVAINAVPNAQQIAQDLIHLIEHPDQIEAIGARARSFIETHHHYSQVAQRYLDTWNDA